MSFIRRMTCDDLFRFNNINLDSLTETYINAFYLHYFSKWPSLCLSVENANNTLAGYIIGKAEGENEKWHGHVTAVTVADEYRRLGMANYLMDTLETLTNNFYNGYFVDLFVRASNNVAVTMYEKLGYVIYRQVIGYYNGKEDAYDMRKAMSRDIEKNQ